MWIVSTRPLTTRRGARLTLSGRAGRRRVTVGGLVPGLVPPGRAGATVVAIAVGGELMPFPLSGIICGAPTASSLMISGLLLAPRARGVKVRPIVQLPPGAMGPR